MSAPETPFELFWLISFFTLLFLSVPLNGVHAIGMATVRRAGKEESPRWLGALRIAGNVVLGIAFVSLSASIVALWMKTGHPPFSNIYESMLWMAWGFCATYFVARLFWKFVGLELGATFGVLIILGAATFIIGQSERPPMPALQSKWLIFHVFTCMISYGALFVAFIAAILWLTIWWKHESKETIDALLHNIMAFGFFTLTIGILSGAVWANQAWGRYWGWDAKETWSLITWLVYGIYLHFRLISGKLGIKKERLPLVNAIFAIVGFLFVMFTFLGVSYLEAFKESLHSYG